MNTDYHFWIPPPLWNGKPKKFSSKIFLTKVLFLETKASELSICQTFSSNYQTMIQTVFHNLLIEAKSMSDVHNCGTARRPRYTYQEPLKLQNVDKVTEEDLALMDVARDMWAGVIKKGLWALSLIAFAMDDRTQRVADEIASIEAISHNTVKALSTVTTPLNVIVEMYIAGLEAKLQALRALVK